MMTAPLFGSITSGHGDSRPGQLLDESGVRELMYKNSRTGEPERNCVCMSVCIPYVSVSVGFY